MKTPFTSLFQPVNLRRAKIGLFCNQAANGRIPKPKLHD